MEVYDVPHYSYISKLFNMKLSSMLYVIAISVGCSYNQTTRVDILSDVCCVGPQTL